jgi:hypothetical protein
MFRKILIANRGGRASGGVRSYALAHVSAHQIAWHAAACTGDEPREQCHV